MVPWRGAWCHGEVYGVMVLGWEGHIITGGIQVQQNPTLCGYTYRTCNAVRIAAANQNASPPWGGESVHVYVCLSVYICCVYDVYMMCICLSMYREIKSEDIIIRQDIHICNV